MPTGALTSYFDVAALTFTAFWLVFAYSLFYLRREDRREGYPLESDIEEGNVVNPDGGLFKWIPDPKVFLLRDGRTVTAPNYERDAAERKVSVNLERASRGPGMPWQPTGNPLESGAGPAAWAMRDDNPDRTVDGEIKIVPLRADNAFYIEPRDIDPRGLGVVATDGQMVGSVRDVWVDRSEDMIRYLEVSAGGKMVLLPITMAQFRQIGSKHEVFVDSVTAEQFRAAPSPRAGNSITLREEDKISAYFGAGHLYATPGRLYWL